MYTTDHWETTFDCLGDRHRRRLLFRLLNRSPDEEPMQVPGDIVPPDSDSETVRSAFRHQHLPKLEDAGYITWNRTTGEISHGPRFEQVRPILALFSERRDELPDGLMPAPSAD